MAAGSGRQGTGRAASTGHVGGAWEGARLSGSECPDVLGAARHLARSWARQVRAGEWLQVYGGGVHPDRQSCYCLRVP